MLNTTPMNVIIAELTVVTTVFVSWENPMRSPSSSYASSRWNSRTIASSSSAATNHSTNTQTNPMVSEPERVAQMLAQRGQRAGPVVAAITHEREGSPAIDGPGRPTAHRPAAPH